MAIWIALTRLIRAADRTPVPVAGEGVASSAGIAGCGVGFGHMRKLCHVAQSFSCGAYRDAPVVGGVPLVGLPHLTPVAGVALPRRRQGECPLPLWLWQTYCLALSSFHPPATSVAANLRSVAFPALHEKMGHAINPL